MIELLGGALRFLERLDAIKAMKYKRSLYEQLTGKDKRIGPSLKRFNFTVPIDYIHQSQVDVFSQRIKGIEYQNKFRIDFNFWDETFTSANFANTTGILEPGRTYKVDFFPILAERIISEHCIEFLQRKHALLVSAQGLTAIYEAHSDKFPHQKRVVSFDEKTALFYDEKVHRGSGRKSGFHMVPSVGRHQNGDQWNMAYFEYQFSVNEGHCLLCVSEL